MSKPTDTQTRWLEPVAPEEQAHLRQLPAIPADDGAEPEPEPGWAGNRFLAYTGIAKALAWFVGGFVTLQAAMLVVGAWQLHWSLGALAAVLVGLPGGWLALKLLRARRNSQRVVDLERLRLEAEQARVSDTGDSFGVWSEQLQQQLIPAASWLAEAGASAGPYANDRERFEALDRILQRRCDQAARQAVVQATRRTALGVAASPFLALDFLLAIAGNLALIGRVARAYGLPPSPFLETRLLVQVYRQIAALGAIELGSEVAGEVMSHSVLAKLSGRMAQGLSAGIYTYRIGTTAMALCRPLAFSEATRPRPGSLFKELFAKLDADTVQG